MNLLSPAHYRFVTQWEVQGPKELVYKILRDGVHYSRWWGKSYISSQEYGPKRILAHVRARLPYTLTFMTEVVFEKPPEEIRIKASGELEGTGSCRIRQTGTQTHIEFVWDVVSNKRFINWFSFLLRPVFAYNHDWVMKIGQESLQRELNRVQGISC